MIRTEQQTDLAKETESFKAFDLLTTALTHIDNYQSSKDKDLLDQAATSLAEALETDKYYFKARYFQAVVKYLKADYDGAITGFDNLLKLKPEPYVAEEIHYNIAVAKSEKHDFDNAITEFDKLLKSSNVETRLLARAGLALSYANLIKDPKQLSELKETEETASIKAETYYKEIQHILAHTNRRVVSDEVVKEVKRIMDRAFNKAVSLPKRRNRKRALAIRRLKRIFAITGGLILLWLLILYFYLYVGLNDL